MSTQHEKDAAAPEKTPDADEMPVTDASYLCTAAMGHLFSA